LSVEDIVQDIRTQVRVLLAAAARTS